MQPQSDVLIDRKRLKKHLSGWRAAAISLLFLWGGSYTLNFPGTTTPLGRDYIAQIALDGVMLDDPDRDALLKQVREDKHAKALIVRMDSPGGTTLAGEELFLQLRAIASEKPVVALMRTVCASACYMAAIGSDHIIARSGTLTGSIGVLLQSVEVSRLAETLGIKPITIKSGEYKDAPSFTEPLSESQRAVVQTLVMDAYDHFVGLIVDRRALSEVEVKTLADGRVYTGSQAIKNHLIDALGGDAEAKQWLTDKRALPAALEVRELKPEKKFSGLLDELQQSASIKLLGSHAIGLDGLVSIWHPSSL